MTPVVRLRDMSEIRPEIGVPEIIFQIAGEGLDVDLTAPFSEIDEDFPLQVRDRVGRRNWYRATRKPKLAF